jgi:hypothetical protein
MEKQILNVLNFELYSPTAVAFLKLYNQVFEFDAKVMVTAFYLADLMLLAVNSHYFTPSLLASGYLFLSLITNELELPVSTHTHQYYTKY